MFLKAPDAAVSERSKAFGATVNVSQIDTFVKYSGWVRVNCWSDSLCFGAKEKDST
jgi:hypothetical protein